MREEALKNMLIRVCKYKWQIKRVLIKEKRRKGKRNGKHDSGGCDHRRLVTSYCVLRPSWREQKSCRRENEFAGDGFCERDEVMREGFYYWILDFSELVGKFASFFFIIIWMGTNEISVRITVTRCYNLGLIRMLLADVARVVWVVRVLKSRLYGKS